MITGLDLLAYLSGSLLLASSPVQCSVLDAPHIKITPTTQEVHYDFSLSAAELGRKQVDTISPYGANVDQISGGLREDEPRIEMKMEWGLLEYPHEDVACMWYKSVNIKIILQPTIYVSKEFARDRTCKNAILEHEHKHIEVDHLVINKFSQEIGAAVQKAVNEAGAVGPFRRHQAEDVQQSLKRHIESAVDSQMLVLRKDMAELQQEVDSLEEYQKISKICRNVKMTR